MILGGLAGTETLTIESILGFMSGKPLACLIGTWEQAGLAGSLWAQRSCLTR